MKISSAFFVFTFIGATFATAQEPAKPVDATTKLSKPTVITSGRGNGTVYKVVKGSNGAKALVVCKEIPNIPPENYDAENATIGCDEALNGGTVGGGDNGGSYPASQPAGNPPPACVKEESASLSMCKKEQKQQAAKCITQAESNYLKCIAETVINSEQ